MSSESSPRFLRWNKPLTVLLILVALGALTILGYVVVKAATGRSSDTFTEFYILGAGGKAEDYPTALVLGEKGGVILGIKNHEQQSTIYQIEITIGGVKIQSVGPVSLGDGEKWEQPIDITPTKVGDQKVEFLLYKDGEATSFENLYFWIDVRLGS